MGNLTKNFSRHEFECKCGCGEAIIEWPLVMALQRLRDLAGVPIVITSGYRCPDHNKAVGGARGSYHLRGMAADIRIGELDVAEMYRLAEKVYDFEFGGIGRYTAARFIHVDVRGFKARWGA